MSEVNATGMQQLCPGVCRGLTKPSRTLFRERVRYWRGQTLYKFTITGFPRTSGAGK